MEACTRETPCWETQYFTVNHLWLSLLNSLVAWPSTMLQSKLLSLTWHPNYIMVGVISQFSFSNPSLFPFTHAFCLIKILSYFVLSSHLLLTGPVLTQDGIKFP